jgi:hypothetical protein
VRHDWTLQEARRALPQVRERLAEARRWLRVVEDLEAHLQDLRLVHGDQVLAPASPGHKEFRELWSRHEAARQALLDALRALERLDVEVKDVREGLVDFRGHVGDVPAYLCWKDGEPDVGHWHPLEGGFAARRRLP